MPKINFDQQIDRQDTASTKWDKYTDKNVLPMWVADTDFKAPAAISDALKERIEHGIFGYTHTPDELNAIIIERLQRLYNWKVDQQWIVWLPGLVSALNIVSKQYAGNQAPVITPNPIYPPFKNAPLQAQLDTCQIAMKLERQRWVMDFDLLEQQLSQEAELLLFCNPHNPAGTVYTKDELSRLAAIVVEHELTICSDEIHCDLLLDKHATHIPIATISPEVEQRSITLMAASKTFNIAGLGCAFAIIPNPKIRQQFNKTKQGIVPDANLLGYTATIAAYSQCADWLSKKLDYLRNNHDYLITEINSIPGLSMLAHQATYLAWIDVSAANLENPAKFFEEAGVGLSPGSDFGDHNFVRLNFGCSKAQLVEAVKRIRNALTSRA
ncbi:MAG: putative aminotransferase [Osedax symbiont Rs1]|nr:MAG: putative aminotransferase [Osedax symbiont Rs1]